MGIAKLLVAGWCFLAAAPSAREGLVTGTVVNASRGKTPVPDTEVVLRIRLGDDFVPFHQSKTDAQGKFRFEHVPIGKDYRYLPGASRDGVHYPGPPFEVTSKQPWVSVDLQVWDSVSVPGQEEESASAEECPTTQERLRNPHLPFRSRSITRILYFPPYPSISDLLGRS